MVILLDRFQNGHIKQVIDTAVGSPWDAGEGGALGLVWKLIFYNYAGQVADQPYTDLPLSREFGRDVVMRTGWGHTTPTSSSALGIRDVSRAPGPWRIHGFPRATSDGLC